MARRVMRKVTAPDFSVAARKDVEIRQQSLLSGLMLVTGYSYTVTGGTGAGNIFTDAAFRLARAITLMVGGKPLHHVRGHTLGVLEKLFEKEQFTQTNPTTDAAGTENSREATIFLPFYMPASIVPDEFAFPAYANKARLVVDWAAALELIDSSGDATSAAFSNVVTKLYEVPLEGVPKAPASRWGAFRMRHVTKEITQSGTPQVELDHLQPGEEIRAIIVESFNAGSSGQRYSYSSSVINNLRFEVNGRDEYEQVDFADLQNRNKREYRLSSKQTGVAVIDFAEDRRTDPGQLLVIEPGTSPVLYLDVTKQSGDNLVVVTTLTALRGRAQ